MSSLNSTTTLCLQFMDDRRSQRPIGCPPPKCHVSFEDYGPRLRQQSQAMLFESSDAVRSMVSVLAAKHCSLRSRREIPFFSISAPTIVTFEVRCVCWKMMQQKDDLRISTFSGDPAAPLPASWQRKGLSCIFRTSLANRIYTTRSTARCRRVQRPSVWTTLL